VTQSGAIVVRGITFEAHHGASAAERERTRRFEVDVEVHAPETIGRAARSDQLADTIDYREVCALVVQAGTAGTCHLIETVAARILDALGERHPASAISVEVRKVDPPCPGSPRSAAVRLSRDPGR